MRGETVVCMAPRRWDGLWKETQAIMSRLARDNRVLYFEPGRDPEQGVVSEARRNWPTLFRTAVREVQSNLLVIAGPPALPHGRRHLPAGVLRATMPVAIAINAGLLIRHVRRAMRARAVSSPVLWLTDPYQVSLAGKLQEKIVCYHNFDEFADMEDNRRVSRLLRRLDDALTRRADVVFATSRAQCQRRSTVNPQTYLIPNAVDFDLFVQAVTAELPLPSDIAHLPRPIVGFVGWLTHHIDVALLRRLAEAYPHCSFVLVGPDELRASPDLQKLRRRPNVVFLGRKEHAAIPAYLQRFDVALMPYIATGHVLSAYPAKLHEYLAAGRAVVATDLPELRPYKDVVRLAATTDDFVQMVGQALDDHSTDAIDARVAVARQNTWDRRVAEIGGILNPLLQVR